MKQIPLNKGYFALVDDCDFEWLSKFQWYVKIHGRNCYACRGFRKENGRLSTTSMHRTIFPTAEEIDHANGNGLDNQRENLRPCTHSQNSKNRRLNKNSTTGLKSVQKVKNGTYRARIANNGARIHLGYFKDVKEAYGAYSEAAKRLHGDFARC